MNDESPISPPFFSNKEDQLKIDEQRFFKFLMMPELHQILHERYVIKQLEELGPEEQEELKLKLGHIALFDIHTTCFPGYLRYVRKQVRKLPWYERHVETLAHLLVLNLLYGEKATLKKAKEKPELNVENSLLVYDRVTERTRRSFFEYYPDLLSKPLRDVMTELDDKREAPFNTIFSAPSIGQMDPETLASMPIPLDKYDIGFMQLKLMMMPLHAEYRMVEPYDTEELIKFQRYMQKLLLDIVEDNGEPEKENQWIYNNLEYGTKLTENLYQTIMLAVLTRWFSKKKSSTRERLLHEKHPLRYTKTDARNAVKYTLEWIQDTTRTFDIILRGVGGLNNYRMPEQGIWLYQECLKQIKLDPDDLGLCYHNLAIQYRNMGNKRKFKITLLKALKVWEENQSQYDIGVTWAFLAHAYFLEGDHDKVKQAKEKTNSILNQIKNNDYQLSHGYIHLADCASSIHDIRWEIEALSKALEHASNLTDECLFDYCNGRLIALNEGKDPFMLEQMGILKRPPMTPWIKIGSSYHPVLPSKDTPTA